jgi:integrase
MKANESVYVAIDRFVSGGLGAEDGGVSGREYMDVLAGFCSYIGGLFVHVGQVTTEDIALYLNFLLGNQAGYHRDQRVQLEPGQYEEIAQKLHKFWRWVENQYHIPSPFIPEDLAEACDRIQPVDSDALQQLIRLLSGEILSPRNRTPSARMTALRNIALLLVLYDAGPRAEELSRLKIEDVDLSNKVILIPDANNRIRKVPISEKLVPRISAYIQSRYPENPLGRALLFPKDEKGNPLDRSTVHEILVSLGHRVGLGNINTLQFRAAFAKHYHDGDMLDDLLIDLMGIENGQQLRLYIDRMGNKKLADVRKKYYRLLQPTDKPPSIIDENSGYSCSL